MEIKSLSRKIKFNKYILNLFLNYLSPTNIFIIYQSERLDKLVYRKQKILYQKYKTNSNYGNLMSSFGIFE